MQYETATITKYTASEHNINSTASVILCQYEHLGTSSFSYAYKSVQPLCYWKSTTMPDTTINYELWILEHLIHQES